MKDVPFYVGPLSPPLKKVPRSAPAFTREKVESNCPHPFAVNFKQLINRGLAILKLRIHGALSVDLDVHLAPPRP